MDLDRLLNFAVEQGASDVHLQAGSTPMLRICGQARFLDGPILSPEATHRFAASILPEFLSGSLEKNLKEGIDFSHAIEGLARFRCNIYTHLRSVALAIRILRIRIPSLEELNLPPVVADIALSRRGLTLVTGTTGSGKSTTLAAMVNLINQTCRAKIITIEDPVEYVHASNKSLISHVELGGDTSSFSQALRQAFRQNPDVILVGELRDADTLRAALQAADTGHQVFSTVHSATAPITVERIIAMFPPAEHELLLLQLANSLEAIVSQRLIAAKDGAQRPAVELLRGSPVAMKLITEKRLPELTEYIATGESGMQTFDQHLLQLFHQRVISESEALRGASNAEALGMAMRGIVRSSTVGRRPA
jgi:twitching motility protein PilT